MHASAGVFLTVLLCFIEVECGGDHLLPDPLKAALTWKSMSCPLEAPFPQYNTVDFFHETIEKNEGNGIY